MKTPKSFGGTFGILNIGMSVVIALYTLIGLFGYISFGEQAQDTMTSNLLEKNM